MWKMNDIIRYQKNINAITDFVATKNREVKVRFSTVAPKLNCRTFNNAQHCGNRPRK